MSWGQDACEAQESLTWAIEGTSRTLPVIFYFSQSSFADASELSWLLWFGVGQWHGECNLARAVFANCPSLYPGQRRRSWPSHASGCHLGSSHWCSAGHSDDAGLLESSHRQIMQVRLIRNWPFASYFISPPVSYPFCLLTNYCRSFWHFRGQLHAVGSQPSSASKEGHRRTHWGCLRPCSHQWYQDLE